MFRNPTGNAFAHFHAQRAKIGGMRNLGCPKNDLAGICLDKVHEASVAFCNLDSETDNLSEHFVERTFGADYTAHAMKKIDLGFHYA